MFTEAERRSPGLVAENIGEREITSSVLFKRGGRHQLGHFFLDEYCCRRQSDRQAARSAVGKSRKHYLIAHSRKS
jgi:hypothetical protein